MYNHCFADKRAEHAADIFLWLSIGVFILNVVSQIAAFPFQILLLIFAICKRDIHYLPAITVLLLDKSMIMRFQTGIIKFSLGIALSVPNAFIITVFLFVCWLFLWQRMDRKSYVFVPLWVLSAIPAIIMAVQGREDRVPQTWQVPLINFMCPALYFWGCAIGKSWNVGKRYFVKRMIVMYVCFVWLELVRILSFGNSFSENIIAICLCVAIFRLHLGAFWKFWGVMAFFGGFANMLFQGYIQSLEETGVAGSGEVVSTFSRLGVVVLGSFVALTFGVRLKGKAVMQSFPWIMLGICSCVFALSVTLSKVGKGEGANLKGDSVIERFEGKLFGDRGKVWAKGLDELWERPLLIKRLKDKEVVTMDYRTHEWVYMSELLPHNQVLTLIGRSGWWLGGTLVVFLWWMCLRMFKAASELQDDPVALCLLLAPAAGIFFVVGLTGQSVLTQNFIANANASLVFPGVLHGAYLCRKNHSERVVSY